MPICTKCGGVHESQANFCPTCGIAISAPVGSERSPGANTLSHDGTSLTGPVVLSPPVAGHRGWLLFLCVVLTIVMPISRLSEALTLFGTASPLEWISITQAVLLSYSGWQLWRGKWWAVRFAMFAIVFDYFAEVAVFVMLRMADLVPSPGLNPIMFGGLWWVGTWLLYLNLSERVRATFRRPIERPSQKSPVPQ